MCVQVARGPPQDLMHYYTLPVGESLARRAFFIAIRALSACTYSVPIENTLTKLMIGTKSHRDQLHLFNPNISLKTAALTDQNVFTCISPFDLTDPTISNLSVLLSQGCWWLIWPIQNDAKKNSEND